MKEKYEGVDLKEEEKKKIDIYIQKKELNKLVINSDYYPFILQIEDLKNRRKNRSRSKSIKKKRKKSKSRSISQEDSYKKRNKVKKYRY